MKPKNKVLCLSYYAFFVLPKKKIYVRPLLRLAVILLVSNPLIIWQ